MTAFVAAAAVSVAFIGAASLASIFRTADCATASSAVDALPWERSMSVVNSVRRASK